VTRGTPVLPVKTMWPSSAVEEATSVLRADRM
jgi:hypothetical protein